MSILKDASSLIKTTGNGLNDLFTSDDERLTHAELMERIQQRPDEIQVELNKLEAKNESIFIAGWRPFIGWVCGFALLNEFLLRPLLSGLFNINMPSLNTEELLSLLTGLLGFAGLRTFEKRGKKSS